VIINIIMILSPNHNYRHFEFNERVTLTDYLTVAGDTNGIT